MVMDFTKILLHKMHLSLSLFIVLHMFMGFGFLRGCLVIVYIFAKNTTRNMLSNNFIVIKQVYIQVQSDADASA